MNQLVYNEVIKSYDLHTNYKTVAKNSYSLARQAGDKL